MSTETDLIGRLQSLKGEAKAYENEAGGLRVSAKNLEKLARSKRAEMDRLLSEYRANQLNMFDGSVTAADGDRADVIVNHAGEVLKDRTGKYGSGPTTLSSGLYVLTADGLDVERFADYPVAPVAVGDQTLVREAEEAEPAEVATPHEETPF